MAFKNIGDFKAALVGGGARSSLFEVELNFPNGSSVTGGTQVTATSSTDTQSVLQGLGNFLVKSAALPASNITPIEVPFRDRILKLAGERTFDTWTVSVINDTDFKLRNAFEKWMNGINNLSNGGGKINPIEYYATARVFQLDRNGNILRRYKFVDVFPTNISQIDLSYDSVDQIEEFSVEFQVTHWTVESNSGTTSGTGTAQVTTYTDETWVTQT